MIVEEDHATLHGDCREVLAGMESEFVDLIVTSPPYAQQRKQFYGGVSAENYVEWFLARSAEFKRVLKPSGSFVLNIKEHTKDGEKHPYVMQLVLALREQGWRWVEQYIWHKTDSMPGQFKDRFKDSWEHVFHFSKTRSFKMFREAVMVEAAPETKKQWLRVAKKLDRIKSARSANTGKKNVDKHAWRGLDGKVYPSNVLSRSTVNQYRGHPATFPDWLPEWFIRLFTEVGDMVLDPFVGSGTSCLMARQLGRRSIGIDAKSEYVELARRRVRTGKIPEPGLALNDLPRLPFAS